MRFYSDYYSILQNILECPLQYIIQKPPKRFNFLLQNELNIPQQYIKPQSTSQFCQQQSVLFKSLRKEFCDNTSDKWALQEQTTHDAIEDILAMITSLQLSKCSRKDALKSVRSFIHLIAYEAVITLAESNHPPSTSALQSPFMEFIMNENLYEFDDKHNDHWNNRVPLWLEFMYSMADTESFSDHFRVSKGTGDKSNVTDKAKKFFLVIYLFRQAIQTWNHNKTAITIKIINIDGEQKTKCAQEEGFNDDDPFTLFLFLCKQNLGYLINKSNDALDQETPFTFITLKKDIFLAALTEDFQTLLHNIASKPENTRKRSRKGQSRHESLSPVEPAQTLSPIDRARSSGREDLEGFNVCGIQAFIYLNYLEHNNYTIFVCFF
jgi:hypothetical protein